MTNAPDERPDMTTVKLKDIKPNPFRHIERYPIRPEKVRALRDSFRVTGYWGNIVARPSLDPSGGVEIAYGHHRLAALREEYGPSQDIALLIKSLSDEQMLQIMARENMEEWGTSAVVEQETVRALVEAFAAEQVKLPPMTRKETDVRYAPSFSHDKGSAFARTHFPYTNKQIAEFLGWNATKVGHTLRALELVEAGILADSDFEGLSTKAAEAVTIEARRAIDDRERTAKAHQQKADKATDDRDRRQHQQLATKARGEAHHVARHVGKTLSTKLKRGEIGASAARDTADRIYPRTVVEKPKPNIDQAAVSLCGDILDFLDPEHDFRGKRLAEIIGSREYLSPRRRDELAGVLRRIADRVNAFADELATEPDLLREAING